MMGYHFKIKNSIVNYRVFFYAKNDAIFLYKQLDFGNLKGRIKIVFQNETHDPSKIYEEEGSAGIIKLLRKARKYN